MNFLIISLMNYIYLRAIWRDTDKMPAFFLNIYSGIIYRQNHILYNL